MTPTSLAAFRTEMIPEGFDEVLEREWPPNTVIDTHTHDFDVSAIVTRGDMWLTCEGRTRHLKPGDRFMLARGSSMQNATGPKAQPIGSRADTGTQEQRPCDPSVRRRV